MADRVTFRERTAGVCVATDVGSIQAVSICEPRVKFIKGYLNTETDPGDGSVPCGDGSPHCMLATPDQMAELLYRVKDSKVTGCGMSVDWSYVSSGSTHTGTADFSLGGGLPPSNLMREDNNVSFTDFGGSPKTGSISSYRASLCVSYSGFGNTDYVTDLGGRFGSLYFIDVAGTGDQARDPISELGMWSISSNGFAFESFASSSGSSDYLMTGMCQGLESSYDLSQTDESATEYTAGVSVTFNRTAPFGDSGSYYEGCFLDVAVMPEVAFIDITGSGDPYDAGNSRFVKVEGNLSAGLSTAPSKIPAIFALNTNKSIYGSGTITSASLNLIVSSGTLSCPLYFDELTSRNVNLISASDITVEATEWWPYKKLAGTPAWNTTTGAPIGDIAN